MFLACTVQVYVDVVLPSALQLHEMDIGLGLSDIMKTPEFNCDVVCLLYDVTNPKSFAVCARIYEVSIVLSWRRLVQSHHCNN